MIVVLLISRVVATHFMGAEVRLLLLNSLCVVAGARAGKRARLTKDTTTVNSQHRLLVIHHAGIIVAVPLMLDGSFATVQQAKSAIVPEVEQLFEVMQSIHSIIPPHSHRSRSLR